MPSPEAALLVAVVRSPHGDRLVFVRRGPRGVHGRQIGFPGGRVEEGDADLVATAIREAAEETGVDPARVTVLAELPVVEDRSSGMWIRPYLAEVEPPLRWRPQVPEIVEVLEIPVAVLADPANRAEGLVEFAGWPEPRWSPYIAVGEDRIWGLTYRVLLTALEALRAP